jgi:hypothetical protein
MQIIENWSDINGIVRSLHPSPTVSGFTEVELQVEKVQPVEGFANLLGDSEGKSLVVLMPEELVRSLDIHPGDVIECRVRRASLDRSFVHRHHVSVRHAN